MNTLFKKTTVFILFLFLFPYSITVFTYGIHQPIEEDYTNIDSMYRVQISSKIGEVSISLEEYLLGVLASCIDPSYELEMIKVQAVILRTNFMLQMEDENFSWNPTYVIDVTQMGNTYYDVVDRKELWGESYEEYAQKFYIALVDTKNMVITVNEEWVVLPFFALSAGVTREASDLLEDICYKGMEGVSCKNDILSPMYLQSFTFSRNDISQAFGMDKWEEEWEIVVAVIDDANYVLKVEVGNRSMSGEEFRNQLSLPSSNFTIYQEGKDIIIHTKGIGHGIGLSQYTGNDLAKEGKGFEEILEYFYHNIGVQLYL
ncbi:MAG: SpoIID/LytB domain-containing protein [Eubacteriales bacterium]